MSTPKAVLLSILVACWIVGLVNQFHTWQTTFSYLILSMLIIALVAAKRQYQMAYAKDRRRPRR